MAKPTSLHGRDGRSHVPARLQERQTTPSTFQTAAAGQGLADHERHSNRNIRFHDAVVHGRHTRAVRQRAERRRLRLSQPTTPIQGARRWGLGGSAQSDAHGSCHLHGHVHRLGELHAASHGRRWKAREQAGGDHGNAGRTDGHGAIQRHRRSVEGARHATRPRSDGAAECGHVLRSNNRHLRGITREETEGWA